jgi:hypothetical protein
MEPMMRIIYSISLCVLLAAAVQASSSEMLFHHEPAQGVIHGEDAVFELIPSSVNSGLYDMRLFYREFGESEFKMILMERDGMVYHATIGTAPFTTGMIEYYFGFEGALGAVGTLPSQSPEMRPFQMRIAPSRSLEQQSQVEVIILSPQPDEAINNDELIIAASLLGLSETFDFSNTKLLIDGTNVSNMVEVEEGIITFSPQQIRVGVHNIELNILDANQNVIGKKEWSFRATGGGPEGLQAKKVGGTFFLENRNQATSTGDDNFLRTGLQIKGRASDLDWRARFIYSSEESDKRQPVNRYAVQGRWNFSDRNNIYLKLGDFTPYYSPLTFQNKRVRGVQAGLAYGVFTLDFISGQLNRGVDGIVSKDSVGNVIGINGFTFEESILAIRPGFRFGDYAHWHLNLLNSKEEKASEVSTGVKESLVFGTDLNLNFDKKRILFDASFQASINNTDAGSEEVVYDSIASKYDLGENDAAKSAWEFLESTGFFTMTQGLNPLPSFGMRFQTQLRYFNNNLIFRYTNIDRDFSTRGNPYLVKDVSGLYIADNFRMLNNQVFVNLFYKNFKNNKSDQASETSNTELGLALSYFPMENLPSLTVSFSNIGRSNDLTPSDSGVAAVPEDNTTQLVTVSTSYNVDFGNLRNTLLLNFSNYNRDEAAEGREDNDNTFNVFGVGIKTRFNFPLTTRLHFSTEESELKFTDTVADSLIMQTNNIQKIAFGAEYLFRDIFGNDRLKPFVNVVIQTSELKESKIEINRNNYTFGLAYRSSDYGIFSLRYDVISFEDFDSDTILNAKYQYNF